MNIQFQALIKDIKSKALVSGDKSTDVLLRFDSQEETDILNALNVLQRGDTLVDVSISNESWEKQEIGNR